MSPIETTVKVRPDKRFFVDMLTKDITLGADPLRSRIEEEAKAAGTE